MKRTTSLASCCLLAAIAGCVAAPPVEHPDIDIAVPETWTTESRDDEVAPGAWWRTFGDARLDALVSEAITRNQDLRASLARLDASIARARIAGADLYPSLGAAFNAGREQRNFVGFPIPGAGDDVLTTRSTNVSLSLDTSWEIDLWGRIRAGKSAALADVQAARLDVAFFQQSVAAQVCRVWFAAVEGARQLELARATAESLAETAEWIRERYRRGLRTALDLRLAESVQASAEAAVEQRHRQRDDAVRQLEVILARYPANDIAVASQLPAVPPPVPAGLPADLVRRRPDVARAERELAASGARVKEATAALYPRVALTASGGTLSDEVGDLLNGDFSVWSIAGNLAQPIFDGWRLRAGVDLAEASEQLAWTTYAAATLTAYQEVESALAAQTRLARREEKLQAAFDQAAQAYRLARDQYRAGVGGYLPMLESQRQTFEVESELIAVRRQRLDARAQLHLALGGGFPSEAIDEAPDSNPPGPDGAAASSTSETVARSTTTDTDTPRARRTRSP